MAKPHEIGDKVISSKEVLPVGFKLVSTGDDNLYFYDDFNRHVFIYSNNGILLGSYDFNNGSEMIIVAVDEENSTFSLYGSDKYYTISFSGEIIDIYEVGFNDVDKPYKLTNNYEEYKVVNNFFFYSVYNNDLLLFRKTSLLPAVMFVLFSFFGGLIFLHRKSDWSQYGVSSCGRKGKQKQGKK